MALTPIVNENLTTQVNGTNKVFTLANSGVSSVSQLNFDGAEYFDFTVTATNQITLVDAPQSYLYADYYIGSGAISFGGGAFLTVQDGIDRITRQKKRVIGEVSNQLWLDFFNALNKLAYQQLVKMQPQEYIKTTTISVVSGTEDYAQPADLQSMKVSIAGLFDVDSGGKRKYPVLQQTEIDSPCYGYTRRGGKIYFTPTPTANRSVIFDYIPSVSLLTATTDSLVINDEHLTMVMEWLTKEYGEWNLNVAEEMAGDQRFSREFERMLSNIAVEPKIFII